MRDFQFTKQTDGEFFLSGKLTRQSLSKAKLHQYKELFLQSTLKLDLSELARVDTAGLAWLLLIIEHCRTHNIQISFSHLPSDLVNLAKLSAVDNLLTA